MPPLPKLPATARKLLFAFVFLGLAQPMIGTFTTVFLWRQGKSFPVLILYTLAFYLFLPLGFFLSYRLVGRVTHRFLFLLGTIGAGIIPLLIIFSPTFLPAVIVSFGALLGIAQGFLWSTRNYLTLNATTKSSRLRFSSIESLIGTLCGIIIPLLIGWSLELGTRLDWFSLLQGYRWMGVIGCVLLGIGGMAVYDRQELTPKPVALRLFPVTRQWKLLRSLDFTQGMVDGMKNLLPTILTVLFIGMEGAVGTFSSIGALVTCISIFLVGRYITHGKRLPVLAIPLVTDALAGLAAILLPSPIGIIVFLVVSVGTGSLRWWVTAATMYHAVEIEKQLTGSSQEGLLLDREFILDMGRVLGLGLFLLAYRFAPIQAPFIAIAFVALIQLVIYPICKQLDEEANKVAN
ncbi:hypothetical protein KBD34_01840 [Patescibacteria group bacterium]|nr:hypothetical protein [Patescibacteria group bacterium]